MKKSSVSAKLLKTLSNNITFCHKCNSGLLITRFQVTQAGLKLLNFLNQIHKCWDHSQATSHLALKYYFKPEVNKLCLKDETMTSPGSMDHQAFKKVTKKTDNT